MARLPTPGSDNGIWGKLLNDFLSVSHNADGSVKASAIPPGFKREIKVISSAIVAEAANCVDYVYIVGSGGSVTLPSAVNNTCRYTVVNSATGSIAVIAAEGQKINDSIVVTLPLKYMSLSFISNNSNWVIE